MRPTNLTFRSPKERTEFNTDIIVTNYGEKLFSDI